MIKIKRIYDGTGEDDGYRILVDRLWPRGIKKEEANIDKWMKEIAPSDELRKSFSHNAEKFDEFKERYIEELKDKKDLIDEIIEMSRKNNVTLLYSAKDEEHNNAVVLKEYIEKYIDNEDADNLIKKICLFGKAISDPKRVEMLMAFAKNKKCYEKADGSSVEDLEERPEGICVCNFVGALNMAQSKVSYHIKVLKEAGLITEMVVGKWRYYNIDCDNLNRMIKILKTGFDF